MTIMINFHCLIHCLGYCCTEQHIEGNEQLWKIKHTDTERGLASSVIYLPSFVLSTQSCEHTLTIIQYDFKDEWI